MSKSTRTGAVDATRPSSLTSAVKLLQADADRPVASSVEHPVTRDVNFLTDIYNVALLERLSAHCGLPSSRFAEQIFVAALDDAADLLEPDIDGDLETDCMAFASAYEHMRFNRERLTALVEAWRSQQLERRIS